MRNPFNPKLVSRINFDNVDLILFCTKNPLPIIKHLKEIDKPILFHVTLTAYKEDIEPNVKSKAKIIEGIKEISRILGKENIVVRYDPIFFSSKYTVLYHKKAFERLCSLLDGYVERIIVSFMSEYKNVKQNQRTLNYHKVTTDEYEEIGLSFSNIAKEHNMSVQTCCSENDLVEYGFIKGECLSHAEAFRLTNKTFKTWKSRKCGCVELVDIGNYNSCSHFCKYCYANYDEKKVQSNIRKHDINSSLLVGHLEDDDVIKERH